MEQIHVTEWVININKYRRAKIIKGGPSKSEVGIMVGVESLMPRK